MTRLRAAWAMLAGAALPLQLQAQDTVPLKLLEFGWDRPSPAFVRDHQAEVDARPFDGVVMQFTAGPRFLRRDRLDTTLFAFDQSMLTQLRLEHVRHNFVLVGATPDSGFDWFDDAYWRMAEVNLRQFARTARAGGLRGLFVDFEPYGENLWRFPNPTARVPSTFEATEAQVRRRGRAFIDAIEAEFPGLELLTTFLLSFHYPVLTEDPRGALRGHFYPLLPAFIDGMLDGIDSSTVMYDGNERAYYYRGRLPYFAGVQQVRLDLPVLLDSLNHPMYRHTVRSAQAVFLDQVMGLRTPPGIAARLTTEERLAWLTHNTYYALRASEGYAWLYSQRVDWWRGEFTPELEAAVRAARDRARAGLPLGYTIEELLR